MTSNLYALSFDANEPQRLAKFWADFLDLKLVVDEDDGGFVLLPSDATGFRLGVLIRPRNRRPIRTRCISI